MMIEDIYVYSKRYTFHNHFFKMRLPIYSFHIQFVKPHAEMSMLTVHVFCKDLHVIKPF